MQGLVAAVVTPMTDDGELNLGLVPEIVDHLERNRIAGVYIAGSTGEGMSLTDEERMAVAEAYLQYCRGRMQAVVQVGQAFAFGYVQRVNVLPDFDLCQRVYLRPARGHVDIFIKKLRAGSRNPPGPE